MSFYDQLKELGKTVFTTAQKHQAEVEKHKERLSHLDDVSLLKKWKNSSNQKEILAIKIILKERGHTAESLRTL